MTVKKVSMTRVAVFPTREAAERAVEDLRAAGYKEERIGMVGKDASGKTTRTDGAGKNKAAEGAAIGAATGAAAGTAIGVGVLTGVIPVIGPVLALGTLGTVLLNAAGAAAAGGIAGGLIGWGIPEEDARYYEGEVNAGRYLVTADATGHPDDPDAIFTRHGGYNRASRH